MNNKILVLSLLCSVFVSNAKHSHHHHAHHAKSHDVKSKIGAKHEEAAKVHAKAATEHAKAADALEAGLEHSTEAVSATPVITHEANKEDVKPMLRPVTKTGFKLGRAHKATKALANAHKNAAIDSAHAAVAHKDAADHHNKKAIALHAKTPATANMHAVKATKAAKKADAHAVKASETAAQITKSIDDSNESATIA